MTVLADCDIERYRRLGMLDIAPWDDELLQPVSYDLTLAPYVTYPYKVHQKNFNGQVCMDAVVWHSEKFGEDDFGNLAYELDPGEFALFSTIETVTLGDNVLGEVEGKSTIARNGVIIHFAGLVDPGFTGQLTLEVKNLSAIPFTMKAGMKIAQLKFSQTLSKVRRPYGSPGVGHYQGQKGPTKPVA